MSSMTLFYQTLNRSGGYPVNADGTYYVYGRYKTFIASDCRQRCVYCDCHESELGGPEMMQLDHFRPESRCEFAHLRNDPHNLHYSCGRCNLLKSDNWPAKDLKLCCDGDTGFIDPFVEGRDAYFSIAADGSIEPLTPPAMYVIKLLQLDRQHLRKLRYRRQLKDELKAVIESKRDLILKDAEEGKIIDLAALKEIFSTYDRIISLVEDF